MTTKTVEEAIIGLQNEIGALNAELRKKKDTVNTLCGVIGRPPAYAVDEPERAALPGTIRSDQFYGQPLAASARTILEMRKAANLGAASVNEIFDALQAGGYQFQTKSDEVSRASLRNSLAKNTAMFHKLPNGRFGLAAWYPNVRPVRGSSSSEEETNEAADTASSDNQQTEEDR